MNNPLELKEGKLVFEDDKIIISDNAKSQRNYWLILTGLQVFCGAIMVLRFLKNGDQVFLWSGLFLSVVNFVIFVGFLLRSVRSEIYLREVKSMKCQENFENDFLAIELKNNRIRRVSQVEKSAELQGFIDKISAR
jgi:hypothetical protein